MFNIFLQETESEIPSREAEEQLVQGLFCTEKPSLIKLLVYAEEKKKKKFLTITIEPKERRP